MNVRLGLYDPISRSKPPVIEFDCQAQEWRVWTTYNSTLSEGTYIALLGGGTMQRRSVLPNGMVTTNTL